MKRIFHTKTAFFLTMALSVVVFLASLQILDMTTEDEKDHQHKEVSDIAYQLASRLQIEVSSDLDILNGFLATMAINPNMSAEDFDYYASRVVERRPRIRNIAFAKGFVISNVYPYEGNESVLGLDYRTLPAQFEAVMRLLETGGVVIAGPLNLVQGGVGIIGRISVNGPFQMPDGSIEDFGFVSTVIDFDALLQSVNMDAAMADWDISIRGKDGLGQNGDVFLGDDSLFNDQENIFVNIDIPGGAWILAARPKGGWVESTGLSYLIYVFTAILWLFLVLLVLVGERRRVHNRRLRAALEDAQKADRAKSAFLANLSHDLRTPLNSIIGFSDLISNKTYGEDFSQKYTEAADLIHRSGLSLLESINNLLSIASAGRTPNKLKESKFNIRELCELSSQQTRFLREEKQQELKLNLDDEIGIMLGDPSQVLRIFNNLIVNAIKFSPVGSVVKVSLSKAENGDVVFAVRNTGNPIPADKISEVQKPFVRYFKDVYQSADGSGLGLAIVNEFAAQHEAQFALTSDDNETSAIVTFPAKRFILE